MFLSRVPIGNDVDDLVEHESPGQQGVEDLLSGRDSLGDDFSFLSSEEGTSAANGTTEPNHKLLISGDVVFRHGSFGRVDFPTGNGTLLKQSIERLANLPVEMLLPGHMGIAFEDGLREIKLSLQFARQVL